MVDLNGVDRAALGGLLDLALLLREDLVPGGGHPLVRHKKGGGADTGAQAAADTVFIDMDVHDIPSFPG